MIHYRNQQQWTVIIQSKTKPTNKLPRFYWSQSSHTPKCHTDFCAYKAHTVCYMCICLLCFSHMHKNCTSILGWLTMKFYNLFKINTVAHVGDSKFVCTLLLKQANKNRAIYMLSIHVFIITHWFSKKDSRRELLLNIQPHGCTTSPLQYTKPRTWAIKRL